jgi:hypothetical protein
MIRQNYIQYYLDEIVTVANGVDTAFPTKTLYIPENLVAFESVTAKIYYNDKNTALGNITRRQGTFQLGSNAPLIINNTQLYTNSGENRTAIHTFDLTSYFADNWTGASMMFDASVLFNNGGTDVDIINVVCELEISYKYDDISTTYIKTVRIPVDGRTSVIATTKTEYGTLPALDTFLPESGKVFRDITFVIQGGDSTAAVTPFTLNSEIDSLGEKTLFREGTFNSQRAFKWINQQNTSTFDTSVTHTNHLWSTLSNRFSTIFTYVVVTYEYNPATTTRVMQSLLLPMELPSPISGTTSANATYVSRDVLIEEPNPDIKQSAMILTFHQSSNANIGIKTNFPSGAFQTYSVFGSSANCGSRQLMRLITNDVALTRGRNKLQVGLFNSSVTANSANCSILWILNYESDIASGGIATHNKTIRKNILSMDAGGALILRTSNNISFAIEEPKYYINSVGIEYILVSNSIGNPAGVSIGVAQTAEEGGVNWHNVAVDVSQDDPETGIRWVYAQARSFFQRWIGDYDPERYSITTPRTYRAFSANSCASFDNLDMFVTYHSITSTVSGNITNSNGGEITITLIRANTGEEVLRTTRTGNGAYSFDWYDDTEPLYVDAYENNEYKGRTGIGFATLD